MMQSAMQVFRSRGNLLRRAVLSHVRVAVPDSSTAILRPAALPPVRFFDSSATAPSTGAGLEERGFESTTISDILKAKGKSADGSWLWCTTQDTVYDAVKSMTQSNVGALVVVKPGEEKSVAGIITERGQHSLVHSAPSMDPIPPADNPKSASTSKSAQQTYGSPNHSDIQPKPTTFKSSSLGPPISAPPRDKQAVQELNGPIHNAEKSLVEASPSTISAFQAQLYEASTSLPPCSPVCKIRSPIDVLDLDSNPFHRKMSNFQQANLDLLNMRNNRDFAFPRQMKPFSNYNSDDFDEGEIQSFDENPLPNTNKQMSPSPEISSSSNRSGVTTRAQKKKQKNKKS